MSAEPFKISIRDPGVVVALITSGFEVEDRYIDPDGRIYFVFQESVFVRNSIHNYYANTLKVKARIYFETLKSLTSLINGEG